MYSCLVFLKPKQTCYHSDFSEKLTVESGLKKLAEINSNYSIIIKYKTIKVNYAILECVCLSQLKDTKYIMTADTCISDSIILIFAKYRQIFV